MQKGSVTWDRYSDPLLPGGYHACHVPQLIKGGTECAAQQKLERGVMARALSGEV